jgi:hypothetical protein
MKRIAALTEIPLELEVFFYTCQCQVTDDSSLQIWEEEDIAWYGDI